MKLDGCGDHSCLVSPPNGIGTNGGCACFRDLDFETRRRMKINFKILKDEVKRLRDALIEIISDGSTPNGSNNEYYGAMRDRLKAIERIAKEAIDMDLDKNGNEEKSLREDIENSYLIGQNEEQNDLKDLIIPMMKQNNYGTINTNE